jgi:hypothetical protein
LPLSWQKKSKLKTKERLMLQWAQSTALAQLCPEMRDMGTLRCDGCGEEFTIFHHPGLANKENAARQAHWLEKVLAVEHEQERNAIARAKNI